MTTRRPDDFPRFLREHVRPTLKHRGYRFRGQAAATSRGPATAHLSFLRYTSAANGQFDVRMSLTLDPYYMKELGVVVAEDLSIRTYGSVAAAPWQWPTNEPDWPALAATLVSAVVSGAEWLESFLNLQVLAEHLEMQRRVSPEADAQAAALRARMTAAGISTLYESPGFRAPRAGRLRPDKVKALSYCYELMGDWTRAFDAWNDYLTTLANPRGDEAITRRTYRLQKSGAVQQGVEADEA